MGILQTSKNKGQLLKTKRVHFRKIREERRLRIEANRKLEQQREMRKKEEEELNKRLQDLKRLQVFYLNKISKMPTLILGGRKEKTPGR